MPNNWKELDYSNRVSAVDPNEIEPRTGLEVEWSFKIELSSTRFSSRSLCARSTPEGSLISDMQVINFRVMPCRNKLKGYCYGRVQKE